MSQKQKKSNFPNRKDYVYIIIIFTMTLVFILSHVIVDIEGINAKLSFSGTITSIILSVIAILYTLVESIKNSKVQNELSEASEKIGDMTTSLDESMNKLSNLATELEKMDDVIEQISCAREEISISNDKTEKLMDMFGNQNSIKNEENGIDIYIEKTISNKALFKFTVLLGFVFEKEIKVKAGIKKYAEDFNNRDFGMGVGGSYFTSLSSIGLIEYDYDTDKILEYDKRLLGAVKKHKDFEEIHSEVENALKAMI